jgi:hypothetical protein
MDVVIDYEILLGTGKEVVVKALSIASDGVSNTFHFRSPIKWPLTVIPIMVLRGMTAILITKIYKRSYLKYLQTMADNTPMALSSANFCETCSADQSLI